ncbi:MAG: VOC family protein [Acidimicrobiales bacterium]
MAALSPGAWKTDAVEQGSTTGPAAGGIVVFAHDVDRIAAFYQQVLGLQRLDGDPTWVRFGGAHEVVVHGIPEEFAATSKPADPPLVRDETAVKPWFAVASLAASREVASRFGGWIADESRQWRFDVWDVCDGTDPEGNVIQLREMIG